MAFFKTKAEKEIMAQMQRDEQMQIFNDQINELKAKRQEYAHIAAEAEVNGDQGSYDVALSALMELNDVISSLSLRNGIVCKNFNEEIVSYEREYNYDKSR